MQTTNKIRLFTNRLLDAPSSDPDDSRRRKILNTILVFVASLTIFVLIAISIVGLLGNFTSDTPIIYLICIALLVGTALLYFLNRIVAGWIASGLFLLFLMFVFAFSDTPDQLINGRSLFVFTIPIIMASMLLRPSFSFIAAAFIIIEMYTIADISNLPLRVNPVAVAVFFMVAAISWLSSRSLEQALKDLRHINANLDQEVIERTQALSESLERERIEAGRNQAILNSIADGVIVFDRKWNATMANPAVKGMLEIPLELIAGKNFRELIEHPRLQPKSRSLLYAMMEHDTQPIGFRIEWAGKTLSVSAAQVYNNRSQNIGTVTVFRDFTREAEVEKLKSTFVAIVSHELRTPLNAVLGYAEMFKESVYGPVNEKQVNMADRIMKNTQRLLGLINDLLDQAQMEAGKLTIKMAPVKPAELLENLHSVMDKTASDKGLMLTSEIEDNLPERVNGDAARLQQILVNLVNNAVKFTDQGSVHVKLFYPYENKWGIEVSDTGHGISESELPHIFETFRQVEGATTRVHGGFGLGLSIVKQLVNLMNGEIKVQSKVDVGTSFVITLPLVVSQSAKN